MLIHHAHQTFHHTWLIIKRSFKTLKAHPQILIYPYLALIFILLTSPIVGRFIFAMWQRLDRPELIDQISDAAPRELLVRLGLVSFVVFYTFFVTSYFTCMIAASTLAELEGKPTSLLYGLKLVVTRFLRVTKFAVLAIFFFPLSVIAQRKKLANPRGLFEVISSSLSLNMAQLAPAIITDKSGVMETIRHSIDALGRHWRESLVIRAGTFGVILLLASLSFLPKLVEHYWFDSNSAQAIGWIVAVLLGASSYVVVRVIGAVLTTTLYFKASSQQTKELERTKNT